MGGLRPLAATPSRNDKLLAPIKELPRITVLGGVPMRRFQLNFLEGYSGQLVYRETIEAEDDDQAIGIAESRRGLAPMELVCDGRVVRQWPAFPPT